jgi:homoserine dehydrogenase
VNGTCNYLFAESGDPLDILKRAQALGLCESGAPGLAETVNAEIKDIILKLCILFNLSGVWDECLAPGDLSEVLFAEEEILRLILARRYRLVVEISPYVSRREPLGVHGRKGPWSIRAEFVDTGSVDFRLPGGADNILVTTDYNKDVTMAFGRGAGPDETASAMIADMLRLVEKSRV